jgi:hypothetical protein
MLPFSSMATRTTKKAMSEAAAALGRKGGKARVPKGLATMDPDDARRIRSAGGKARWAGKKEKK